MYAELTNLLPEDRVRTLRRGYFMRLVAVAVTLLTAIVAITGTLLVPVYVYLKVDEKEKSDELALITRALASTDEVQLDARLTALSKKATLLASLESTTKASAVIRDVLGVARPGITLSGFTLTPVPGAKTSGMNLLVSGTASTRDRLRAYQLALLDAPFVQAADLPISAYAKDTNISFIITITLAQMP